MNRLRRLLDTLMEALGPRNWWPAESPFEVLVGAVLTQNTAWSNVELALENLQNQYLLTAEALTRLNEEALQERIRPAGFYRAKSRTLKHLCQWLMERNPGISVRDSSRYYSCSASTSVLRSELLALRGIGPETADAILCYGFDRPVFVVDAYARRLFSRHRFIDPRASYDDIQQLAHKALPAEAAYLNEAHAVIVETGKQWCRKKIPLCEICPGAFDLAHEIE